MIEAGHGPEPALFVHCMLGFAQNFDEVVAPLADEITATAMDLPGHGKSPDWQEEYDYGDMCVGLALQCLDSPKHLIGHSFGAYVALRVAVEFPLLIRSLTLIEPVFFAAAKPHDLASFQAHLDRNGPTFDAIARGEQELAAQLFTEEWGVGRAWSTLPPSVRSYCSERMPLVAATQPALLEDNANLLPRLGGLEFPVLLLAGSESPPVMEVVCDGLEAALPNVYRVLLQGAGHAAPLTNPNEVAGMIGAFIASQGQVDKSSMN